MSTKINIIQKPQRSSRLSARGLMSCGEPGKVSAKKGAAARRYASTGEFSACARIAGAPGSAVLERTSDGARNVVAR